MDDNDRIPARMMMVLELLPSCGMSFTRAARRCGYSPSYAKKIVSRFAYEEPLRKALHERMKRLLEEAGESDRLIVERILQRKHYDAHRTRGYSITGRSPLEFLPWSDNEM